MSATGLFGKRIAFFAAFTCAVACAGMWLCGVAPADSTVATVTLVEGTDAQMRTSSSGAWKKAEEDAALPSGAQVKTGKTSRVELQFNDNSIIRVNNLTSITITAPSPKSTTVKAGNGQLWLHLKKLETGGTFEVVTPGATAGVRGTTFWVETDETGEEDTISVEEGEVEMERGGKRVMLKKRMMARFAKGRLGDASGFDPEKKQRWEKWTEKHVQKRFEDMRDEITAGREKFKKAAEKAKAVFEEVRGMAKDAREALKAAADAHRKVEKLREAADRIDTAIENKEERGGRGRGKDRGGRLEKSGSRQSDDKIEKLLEEVSAAEDDVKAAARQVKNVSGDTSGLTEHAKQVQADFAELKKNREKFRTAMEVQRKRRAFDPQWSRLKGISDKISEEDKGAGENSSRIEEALSASSLEDKEKGRNLVEHLESMLEKLTGWNGTLAADLKTLDGVRADLKAAKDNLD